MNSIVPEAIVPELKANDRDGALKELVSSLAANGAVPESAVDEIVAALINREEQGSTGFGKGLRCRTRRTPKVTKDVWNGWPQRGGD